MPSTPPGKKGIQNTCLHTSPFEPDGLAARATRASGSAKLPSTLRILGPESVLFLGPCGNMKELWRYYSFGSTLGAILQLCGEATMQMGGSRQACGQFVLWDLTSSWTHTCQTYQMQFGGFLNVGELVCSRLGLFDCTRVKNQRAA